MMRSQGYFPFGSSLHQDNLLQQMIDTADVGTVGVFDLDGCLFDTRQRQITIFREFGSRHGILELSQVKEEHFEDWDLRTPLRLIGLSEKRIDEFYLPLKKYWNKCFFTSTYTRIDHAMPGANRVVSSCHQQGMFVVYLTGRDHTMRRGTEDSLKASGFPYAVDRTLLITKPEAHLQDTKYKEEALKEIVQYGTPTLFIDNEPSNVNVFKKHFPDSLVVFIETDHSFREEKPDPNIPWIRSWFHSDWAYAIPMKASIYR
jgi:hypothetical protein